MLSSFPALLHLRLPFQQRNLTSLLQAMVPTGKYRILSDDFLAIRPKCGLTFTSSEAKDGRGFVNWGLLLMAFLVGGRVVPRTWAQLATLVSTAVYAALDCA